MEPSKELEPLISSDLDSESDFSVRKMAQSLWLHQDFGPAPSIRMLVEDILALARKAHHQKYIQKPIQQGLEQYLGFFKQYSGFLINFDAPQPVIVDPYWGNNWEASSSSTKQGLSVQDNATMLVQENAAASPLLLTWHEQPTQAEHPIPPVTEEEQAAQQEMAEQHNSSAVQISSAAPTLASSRKDPLGQATNSVPTETEPQALDV